MRIEKIVTKNFLGLPALSVSLPRGLSLVCGNNGAGKSSLLEAPRFALATERIRGMRLKSDIKSLLSQGAKDGSVSITVDGETYKRSLKTGEYGSNSPKFPAALPYVLDASRFASEAPDDRRRFLFDLLNVDTSHTRIAELLAQAEVPAAITEEIKPVLRNGFESAEKYARDQAAQARGAWKAITGESYGDLKSANWAPESVTGEVDEPALRAEVETIPAIEQRHADTLKRIGVAEARAAAASNPDVSAARETLPQWKERLALGLRKQDDLRAELQRLEARHVMTFDCPHCSERVMLVGTELRAFEDSYVGSEIDEKRAAARDALETVTSAVRKAESIIAQAERLIADVDIEAGDAVALRAEVKQISSDLGHARLARETLEIRRRETEQTAHKTNAAALQHQAVQDWKRCADQLEPSGVQATLLAQALGPINEQLVRSSNGSGWRRVEIQPDMTITYGGRPHVLCSESERWRADAMVADAIATLAPLDVLLLDRFDVLDHAGRSEAMTWLIDIAPGYSTLLVGATLKTAPTIEGVNVLWLDDTATGRKAA